MDIILATRNPSKALQIREIFLGSAIRILSMDDAAVIGEAYEDDSDDATFYANALLKARYVREQYPDMAAMADDSGICIDAYGGAPGVNSAYWAGRDATREQLTQFVLEKMADKENSAATFHCCVALIMPDGAEHLFSGNVPGTLLRKPSGPAQPNMPYSPLFVPDTQPDGQAKSWAEMTTEEENAISHRGIAFRKARRFLESRM